MMIVDYLSIGEFSLLLIWIILDFTISSKSSTEVGEVRQHLTPRKQRVLAWIIVASNTVISILHLCYCIHGIWKLGRVSVRHVFLTMSWVLVTLYATYYMKTRVLVNFTWPLVLLCWWVFSGLIELIPISAYFFDIWEKTPLPDIFPSPNIVQFTSFPLSVLICFSALFMSSLQTTDPELDQSLLSNHEECVSTRDDFSRAGIWSCLTFRWLNQVFDKAHHVQMLELFHVPKVPESESAESSFSILQESRKQKPELAASLVKAVIYTVWKPLILNAILAGLNTFFSYLGPFLITNFVEFIAGENSTHGIYYGYMLACSFFFAKTVESLTQRHWYFGARQIGVRVRAALMVAIYNNSILTKNSGTNTGKMINFLDVDVERIGDFFWYIHGIWLLPLQVSLALLILYRNLGAAASFSVLAATILVMLSNTPLARIQEKLHSRIMEAKDSRIKATAETLKCMKILKLHSWETAYLNKLLQLRDAERSWIRRYLYRRSVVAFLFWASPTLISVIAFGVCVMVKTPLSAGTVLSALATFSILQEPIYNLPELVTVITQTKVSTDRIQNFMTEEEQKHLSPSNDAETLNVAVDIEPGEYNWEADSRKKPTLKVDKNIKITKGGKVAICGTVGSGKTSFLASILGEIARTSGGRVNVSGSRAYVPQTAWIQTGTVQENILFGKEMDRRWYHEVLEACSLERDIELWDDGDLTIVGERGINLSGGQKQRIQLARAIYNNSDIYLLDDPFSAVDAHTGTHLFKECFLRLLSSKTVIYVTHQLEFIVAADLILVLKDGKVVQSGSKYEDLMKETSGELAYLIAAHNQTLSQIRSWKEHDSLISTNGKVSQKELRDVKQHNQKGCSEILERSYQKDREFGRVKWHVYHTFVTSAYKGLLVPVLLFCQVLFQGLQIGSNYWIAWATEKEDRVSKEKLIGNFVLLSASSSMFILGRGVLLATVAFETAQQLFLGMIRSIFRAPMSFFDTTPSSRILNRSSSDQTTVDTEIPYRLAGLAFALVQLLCIIILMSQVAWPVFILFILVVIISIWYQKLQYVKNWEILKDQYIVPLLCIVLLSVNVLA